MTSIYCGSNNIHHVGVKVIAPDGSFAETPTSKDSYETVDMNEKIEKADYKLGEDGSVIEFLNLNKDKNIRVEYLGDRIYKTTMSPTDVRQQQISTNYHRSFRQCSKSRKNRKLRI